MVNEAEVMREVMSLCESFHSLDAKLKASVERLIGRKLDGETAADMDRIHPIGGERETNRVGSPLEGMDPQDVLSVEALERMFRDVKPGLGN
jgi:hypothetical protein